MTLTSAMRAAAVAPADDITVPKGVAPWSIMFLQSPAFRSLTKSAHLVLAKIVVELASGRAEIRHRDFMEYGISRDSVTAAVTELECLGIITVARHTPHANAFALSQKWDAVTSIEQAKGIRDKARRFGITRRRKVQRKAQRTARAQRLAQIRGMIDAREASDHLVGKVPALAALDDAAVAVLDVIAAAIGRSAGVVGAALSYEHLCERVGVNPNTLAARVRVLVSLGFVTVRRGKRGRSVYTLSEEWRGVGTVAQAKMIATAARQPRKRISGGAA